ncbi:MAG: FAD-dependent oxidoreductase [Acidobacteriota bacterium]|nr:FAD-dependent oxidoreductase [Acidobacteriota bacterium]
MTGEQKTSVLIVGGGVGGCAAALACARAGYETIMTEESDWIGGQLTSQAVPPDEHGWIERFGCTRSYRRFRDGVRDYYRQHYPLTEEARAGKFLNPGNGWVSPLCHEPRVALAVLESMLAPYINQGSVTLLTEHCAVAADTVGDAVRAVTVRSSQTGDDHTIHASYFLDATELGNLLALTKAEFVTGAESRVETGEPNAPVEADPANAQAFSMCFAVSHHDGEEHTIERPHDYDFWREFVPQLTPPWTGRLFSWTMPHPRTMQPHTYRFDPHRESSKAFSGLWSYRRILDRANFQSGSFNSDISLINVPMLDYLLGDLCTATEQERIAHIERAKQQSLSFLYWMQTAAPRPDGGTGFPGLRLREDVTGSRDGLAKMPYIRESRRIRAEFTIREQHVAADAQPGRANRAEQFQDSVGIGYYRIDLHPSTGGDNYIDVASLPFQIPLGALIPVRMENLLPACKNIGTTHITNGCYRLHPVEWNIGEAAGALAAFCLEHQTTPRAVRQQRQQLEAFQQRLDAHGIELAWPDDILLAEGDPHLHALDCFRS